jgi:hypothetical protein
MFGLLGKRWFVLGGLAAAIGIPYLVNTPQLRPQIESAWNQIVSGDSPSPAAPPVSDQTTSAGTATNLVALSEGGVLPDLLEGPPVQDFGDVLRFDVTPRWIMDRWSRVTTVSDEFALEGLRVPLVTGTRLDDVAGTLTYYFDTKHVLQRITVHGFSGDERRLAQFVEQAYGLKHEPSLYAALYLTRWNGKPKSALLVRHAPVVTSAAAHARLEITVELNRPDNYFDLSAPLQQQLDDGRKTWRWGSR